MTNPDKPTRSGQGPEHPLDPLTADEIRQAAAILRRDRGVGGTLAVRLDRAEASRPRPRCAALTAGPGPPGGASWSAGTATDGQAYRAVVSLTGDDVTHWEHLPGQQPNMTVDEWHECDEMLRAHPRAHRGAGPARDHRHVAWC